MQRFMRGAALARYAEVAAELGLDVRALLRKLDIDARILTERDLRFPADKILMLLERSAEATGCETFGLRMAEGRRLSDYGPISLVLAHQPTLRAALQILVRYSRMLNDALVIHVEDHQDDLTIVREEFLSGSGGSWRQGYELAVATMTQIFREPGPAMRPRSVHFTHGPPHDMSLHRRIFGPAVEFNAQFNGITCRRSDIDAPNRLADPGLAQHAEAFVRGLPYAQDSSLTGEVQRAIHQLLPMDGATVQSVAMRLGVTERTLQRRLADEGADFRRLLNEVRRDHAVRYMDNPRTSLWEVAGLLGYRRETSFARWFAGEFGVVPSAWRAARR